MLSISLTAAISEITQKIGLSEDQIHDLMTLRYLRPVLRKAPGLRRFADKYEPAMVDAQGFEQAVDLATVNLYFDVLRVTEITESALARAAMRPASTGPVAGT